MYIMMEGGEKQKEWIILKNLSFFYIYYTLTHLLQYNHD